MAQDMILQGMLSVMAGAVSKVGDVQIFSYPSMAPRRTFPPVGPYWPVVHTPRPPHRLSPPSLWQGRGADPCALSAPASLGASA
jgi:hypothetical protein